MAITTYGIWNDRYSAGALRSDAKVFHLKRIGGTISNGYRTLCGKAPHTWNRTIPEEPGSRVCGKCEKIAQQDYAFQPEVKGA